MELFERAGLAVPEWHPWNGPDDADEITAGREWLEGWVLKPSGNQAAEKTALVKRPELWNRAIEALPKDSRGIVQRIVSGIEVSTEGWFNGERFVPPFNHTFEEKRFLAGNLGPNTGCMGNVVVQAGAGDRLTEATVEPLAPFLAAIGYRGPFDVNAIVSADKAYVLEATSRLGFDAIEALMEAFEEPAGDAFKRIAEGGDGFATNGGVAIAVRLSVPPYPFRAPDRDDAAGEPVLGIDDNLQHLFLCDLYCDRDGVYRTAGADGILLKATSLGVPRAVTGRRLDYVYGARRRVYGILDQIEVPGKQYRTDIGARVNDDLHQLHAWGWV
jgi:phosphoribosylamine-glycine ligase